MAQCPLCQFQTCQEIPPMMRITLAASLLALAACGGAEKAPEAAPAPAAPAAAAAPAPDSAAMKAAADSAAKAAPAAPAAAKKSN